MRFFSALFLALCCSFAAFAAPGDTTWVQANNVQLDYYNNFDTTIKFPDGSTRYRKIVMVFTLGKYVCPGSPTYCSDWDYTVQTYAMNKVGDTVELGRLITPYGKGTRMPASWTQPYYFDVTDYATVLKDSNKIRIHYSGYSGGFTANIRFAMIEGTPERDVIAVKKMWDGSFAFGDAANPIDAKVAATTITAPAGTQGAMYRLNITGHGSDPNGCSEFCQKYYRVVKDGSVVKEKLIWRDNCGSNNLYPQSGTWIYDRGNWCPGDLVHTNLHPLSGVSAGSNFDLGMTFEPYTSTGAAVYTVNGTVIFYKGMNKVLDASVEDIIAPTNNPNHFRSNERIANTTIRLRNTGSTPIENVELEYGVTGEVLTKTFWTGHLEPLTDTVIDLPFAASLIKATGTELPYEVNILKVNRAADNDIYNNKFTTTFTPVPEYPSTFMVLMTTNGATGPGGYSENNWKITDRYGKIVMERKDNAPKTSYRDTVQTLAPDFYTLTVSDDGCDGINFWANPGAGSGSINIKPNPFSTIALKGNFAGDFGCGFTQQFRVGTPSSIFNINPSAELTLSVYPSPASNEANIYIEGAHKANGFLTITDNTGKLVYTQEVTNNTLKLNTGVYSNGLYFVTYRSAEANVPALTGKLVIFK